MQSSMSLKAFADAYPGTRLFGNSRREPSGATRNFRFVCCFSSSVRNGGEGKGSSPYTSQDKFRVLIRLPAVHTKWENGRRF